jgi:biopolymer transport protein ExbB
MNRFLWLLFIFILISYVCVFTAFCKDVRVIEKQVMQKRAELLKKAERERIKSKEFYLKKQQEIFKDKTALKKAVKEIEWQNETLAKEKSVLAKKFKKIMKKHEKLKIRLDEMLKVSSELVGSIRISAKDADSIFDQSLESSFNQERRKISSLIMNKDRFPEMSEIIKLTDALFDEIEKSGQVRIEKVNIFDRKGVEKLSDVLLLGNFSAAYKFDNEVGFLIPGNKSGSLFALSKLPSSSVSKNIKKYMEGKSEAVYIDISRGAALRQITHRQSIFEQIKDGGLIVYPILGIFIISLFIIIERIIFLFRKKMDADSFIEKINYFVEKEYWEDCFELCNKFKNKPVASLILSGIYNKNRSREELESLIQEKILKEIPNLERFLSTLGMLASISPLLGLLGTVTGMINTFHVITYFGTGDPKMMSGGISEALVTTMLGLAVAIPVMLAHNMLLRMMENIISQMEEKSIAFINILEKNRS